MSLKVISSFLVIILSIILYSIRDVPILTSIILEDNNYNMNGAIAPALKGYPLQLFSNILKYLPPLRRHLLNDNHLERIRELSSLLDTPPLYYPLYRSNFEEIELNIKLANESKSLLETELNFNIHSGKYNSILDFARVYRNQSQTPSEVIRRSIKAVREFKKAGLNIFTSLIEYDVLQQAKESDERHANGNPISLLDGVPVAFKDMSDVKYHSICNGQHPKKCKQVLSDDPIVKRLRDAGAIIFGVTIMTEGGVTPLGYNVHYKGPFSPYSHNHYSGGSSSGSAVAVATGIVPIAIGFDGGGSIRIPASMSGVHGLGGTFGRIPFNNRTESTMIKAGPFTTNAFDAGIVYEVIAKPLKDHFYSDLYGKNSNLPIPHTHGFHNIQDLSDVRIGIYPEWFNDADPKVTEKCNEAILHLKSRGAQIINITIPHLQIMSLSHGIKIISEFALGFDSDYHHNWDLLEPNTQITISLAKSLTALEVLSSDRIRYWGFHYIRNLFQKYNLTTIITPTIGVLPPILSSDAREYGENNTPLVVKLLKYIFICNYLGLPGYSVPIGHLNNNDNNNSIDNVLPIGIHLIGNHWTEYKLLRIGNVLDEIYSNQRVPPKEFYVNILNKPKILADWKRSRNGGVIEDFEADEKVIKINVPDEEKSNN